MRAASPVPFLTILALMLMALAAPARSDPPDTNPSAATKSNEARWADLDAQARMTDGDYDGAVQAEQRADAARKQAEPLVTPAPPRPPPSEPAPTRQNAR